MSEQKPSSSPEWDAIVKDAKNLFVSVKNGINVLIKKYSNKESAGQDSANDSSDTNVKSAKGTPVTPKEVPTSSQEVPPVINPTESTPEAPIEVPPPAAPTEPNGSAPTEKGKTDSDDNK